MLPPVLEIYVVHHPDDTAGAEFAYQAFAHFHGTAFSGLIGGAIEVFTRSAPWRETGDAPRPICPPEQTGPNGIAATRVLAIVPVLSVQLARAVEAGTAWSEYLEEMLSYNAASPRRTGIFPLSVHAGIDSTRLGELFSRYQKLAVPSGLGPPEPEDELRCRDLAQGIAQMIMGGESRLQVFISHTRRQGPGEEDVHALIRLVREIIAETRLRYFFDANDLQPGSDWEAELRQNVAASALLALRTDLYASRVWCQREMLIAKRAGMPIVILDSLGHGEERGSFLMDHLPRIPIREGEGGWSRDDLRRGLNLLVDECLKQAVWSVQKDLATSCGDFHVAWWAPHAPEPVTLANWLHDQGSHPDFTLGDRELRIIHPDPPLGPDEQDVLVQLVQLMGHRGAFEVTTPRGLAARGI